MGDFRASIKIEFEILGMKFGPTDWWINWTPDEFPHGCDCRVPEWFEDCFMKAYLAWSEKRFEEEAEERDKAKELEERQTLAQLKAKYEES